MWIWITLSFSLLVAFITVLLIYLINNTSTKKLLPKLKNCSLDTNIFRKEINIIGIGTCQQTTGAYNYYFPQVLIKDEKYDSVLLQIEEKCIYEEYKWLIKFLVGNMGLIVVIPELNSDSEKVMSRIYQEKDADHGLNLQLLTNKWVYICFLDYQEPPHLEVGKFIKLIYIQPPVYYQLKTNTPVLILDTGYECYSRNLNKFSPIKTTSPVRFVKIYGSMDIPRSYATSCGWTKKYCSKCHSSMFILHPTCQQSIASYIIEMFLIDKEKFELYLMTNHNSVDIAEIEINNQQSILCLNASN